MNKKIYLIFFAVLLLQIQILSDNVYNNDGSINEPYFENNWVKYSTIDSRIPLESRSVAAQNIENIKLDIFRCIERINLLEYDKGVVQQIINDLQDDRNKLSRNLKGNLIKATIRLAVITGENIHGSLSAKGSLDKIYDTGVHGLIRLKEAISLASKFKPNIEEEKKKDVKKEAAKYAKELTKHDDIYLDIRQGALKKSGEDLVKKTSTTIMKSLKLPTVKDLNITDKDVRILKDQKNLLGIWDERISQNQKVLKAVDGVIKNEMNFLETLKADLKKEYVKEKANTRYKLEKNKPKKKNNNNNLTNIINTFQTLSQNLKNNKNNNNDKSKWNNNFIDPNQLNTNTNQYAGYDAYSGQNNNNKKNTNYNETSTKAKGNEYLLYWPNKKVRTRIVYNNNKKERQVAQYNYHIRTGQLVSEIQYWDNGKLKYSKDYWTNENGVYEIAKEIYYDKNGNYKKYIEYNKDGTVKGIKNF